MVKHSTHARGIIGVNAAGYWAFFSPSCQWCVPTLGPLCECNTKDVSNKIGLAEHVEVNEAYIK